MEKTPTEIAFEKAQAFDIINGYINEKSLESCSLKEPCDNVLQVRYNLAPFGPTAIILGFLERYFAEHPKSKYDGKTKDVTINGKVMQTVECPKCGTESILHPGTEGITCINCGTDY